MGLPLLRCSIPMYIEILVDYHERPAYEGRAKMALRRMGKMPMLRYTG